MVTTSGNASSTSRSNSARSAQSFSADVSLPRRWGEKGWQGAQPASTRTDPSGHSRLRCAAVTFLMSRSRKAASLFRLEGVAASGVHIDPRHDGDARLLEAVGETACPAEQVDGPDGGGLKHGDEN